MDTITPCRQTISERFPIASFVVRVPERRLFEIACATHPKLFHTDNYGQRTPENFYCSRDEGLMAARKGENTWILPPQDLKRFAGASRLYFALGTYAGKSNENPRFTIAPDNLDRVPSIRLSPDFTGHSIDRGRFGAKASATVAYGSPTRKPLRWGGDIVLQAEREASVAAETRGRSAYDDGFDPSLWRGDATDAVLDVDYIDDADDGQEGDKGLVSTSEDAMEYEDGPDFYDFPRQMVGGGRDGGAPIGTQAWPMSVPPPGFRALDASPTDLSPGEDKLIRELVASGADEAEVRAFIGELKGPVTTAKGHGIAQALSDDGTTIHLPGNTILAGWKAEAFIGLARLTLSANSATAPLAIVFPDAILDLCERLQITVGVGVTGTGGLASGASFGVGMLFAPGRRIGFYGSASAIMGWIASISAGIQLTVVHGGPDNFAGKAMVGSVSVDLSEGIGVAGHVITAPDGRVLGLAAEVSFALSVPVLSAIEVFAEFQLTATTLSAEQSADSNRLSAPPGFRPIGEATSANTYGGGRTSVRSAFRGKHSDYREDDIEERLPIGPGSRALGMRKLDIPEKIRIMRLVGRAESGDAGYSAVNPDTEFNEPGHPAYQSYHIGLSWGFLLFTTRGGALGQILKKAKMREVAVRPPNESEGQLPAEHTFAALFGEHWQRLLDTTDPDVTPDPDARLAPVGETVLWQEPWLSRFQAAGQVPYVQAAQNEVAVTDYFDKIMPVARWLGFDSARGLAMLLDRAVHAGVGGGLSWVMGAIGPIRSDADRQTALAAVTGGPNDLVGFQQQNQIEPTGEWNAVTHAALTGALRSLGTASPIAVPTRDAMLRALLAAAQGTDFEARLQAIFDNTDDFDDTVTYELS